MKGKIIKIGTFLEDGSPFGWEFDFTALGREFDCMDMIVGILIVPGKGNLYAGYTIEELKAIKEGL